ncbi:MAG: terminase gpA endonuclease subunit [Rhodoplanes sp.]
MTFKRRGSRSAPWAASGRDRRAADCGASRWPCSSPSSTGDCDSIRRPTSSWRPAATIRLATCTAEGPRRRARQALVAEQLVSVRTKRGFRRLEWQKMRARNEMLDCRVYARAAAWLLGVAHRIDEATWRRLEMALAVEPEPMTGVGGPHAPDDPRPPPQRAEPYRRPRVAARSQWMSE